MDGIHIACGQITWGRQADEHQVLSDIAKAGYEGTPATPARSAQETVELYAKYGLKPASGGLRVHMPFWATAEERADIVKRCGEIAKLYAELGLTEAFAIPTLTPERRALAAKVRREDAISQEDFQKLASLLNEVGNATLKHGVRTCVHNHVGCHVETRYEIDRLFGLVDRRVVFLGADLGHLAWAGDDVLQFVKDYADSIKALHIKDIDPRVRVEGVEKGWDYGTFSEHGIFAELGEGMVDYRPVFDALEQAGFNGWVVVETDRTMKPTPLESATISRSYLRSLGY